MLFNESLNNRASSTEGRQRGRTDGRTDGFPLFYRTSSPSPAALLPLNLNH